MPFNSPYNDYMYVIDEFNNLGWLLPTDINRKIKSAFMFSFPTRPNKCITMKEWILKDNSTGTASFYKGYMEGQRSSQGS